MNTEEKDFFRKKITNISIFLSILVVFIHAYNIDKYTINDNAMGRAVKLFEFAISQNIARGAVPLFFMISAYLFYQNFKMSELAGKYKSRLRSILVPYLLWNTIHYFVYYFLSRVSFINMKPFELTPKGLFYGIFLYRYNYVFWFVHQLILFILLAPVLYNLLKRKAFAVCYGIVLVALCSLFPVDLGPYIGFDALLYYSIGAYAGLHLKKQVQHSSKSTMLLGATLLLLSQVALYFDMIFNFKGLRIIFCILIAIGIFYSFDILKIKNQKEKLNYPFIIYAAHLLILATVQKLFKLFLPDNSTLALMSYIFSTMFTLAFISLMVFCFRKFSPKMLKILSGGR